MYLFVYGTLKRGFPNHQFLIKVKEIQFLGLARTFDKYPLLINKWGSPFLLPEEGVGHHVQGELYRVQNPDLWSQLDHFEGTSSNLLVRRMLPLQLNKGRCLAYTYYRQPGTYDFSIVKKESLHPSYT